MDVIKYVREMEIEHLSSHAEADTISDSAVADASYREFEREEVLEAGEGKFVPFHAVEYVVMDVEASTDTVDDDACQPVGGGGADENAILDENGTPLENENGETLLYQEGE